VLDSTSHPARRSPIPAKSPKKPRRTRRPPAPKRRRPARAARKRPLREQPLGAGVGDPFAVRRLGIPPQQSRARPQSRVREMSWAQFGEVARELAERIAARFRPDVVLGVVSGGVFVGGALAAALGAEFLPVKFDKKARPAREERLPSLAGKRVLAVDDVTVSGQTLGKARALATAAGATEVRTAALVARPRRSKPDFCAMETDEIVVFGWDYQLQAVAGTGPVDPGEVGV